MVIVCGVVKVVGDWSLDKGRDHCSNVNRFA